MSNIEQLLEIKNATATSIDIYVYGVITSEKTYTEGEVYPTEFKRFIDEANGRDINLYINSPGGNVFAGNAIAAMLGRYEGRVKATIDGICASIATAIFLAADEKYVSSNGLMMYHQAWLPSLRGGNSRLLKEQVGKACAQLDAIDTALLTMYEQSMRNDADFKKVKKSFNSGEDTWLGVDAICETFDVEKLATKTVAYAMCGDLEIPKEFQNLQQKKEPENKIVEHDYMFDF